MTRMNLSFLSIIRGRLIKIIFSFGFSFIFTFSVLANPVGGNVVSGNATISNTTPNKVEINQTSSKAIINWNSFNIGNQEHTHFQQPRGGVTLNRIDPTQGGSQIYGKLTATGQIILINPAGIYFGPGAYVNVGGLIASTSGISDANFLAGRLVFDQPSLYNGSIVNEGAIHVSDYGLVAFLGNTVDNDGLIEAKLGNVVLASGNKFTIDVGDNGLISFAIDENAISSGVDQHGNPIKSAVKNSGQIIANGGQVLIAAQNLSTMLDNSINMKGIVQAQSVATKNGEIILLGNSGKVSVSGKLDASGKNTGEKGGHIHIAADHITIDSTADIDVSGDIGGGEILIGGDLQGKQIQPDINNATTTAIASGAKLSADAIRLGNGGKVIVWSDKLTSFKGDISAKGGGVGGDGGFAEVSGKHILEFQGRADLSAAFGKTGTLLLDPENLIIQALGPTTATLSNSTYISNLNSSVLAVSDLQTALNSASVLVQTGTIGSQAGDITVADNITWSNSNTLTLSAYRNIIFNSGVSITNNANGSLVLRADNTGTGVGTVTTTASSINISGTGRVNIFYNPSSYTTPTTYTNSAAVSPATLTAYMLVNNMTDLSNTRNNLSGTYALSKSLDASSVASFTPIGNSSTPFTGTFYGNNYTIKNLTINTSSGLLPAVTVDGVGLFGVVNNATISNLGLTNLSVTNTGLLSIAGIGSATGGLIGYALGNTNVSDIYTTGTVAYDNIALGLVSNVGGLIGYTANTVNINRVQSNTTVSSRSQVSAIVGAISNIGGLVGVNNGTINNASAAGTLAMNGLLNLGGSMGGLVGTNTGSISTSYSVDSSITGNIALLTNKGGFIGANSGTLSNDYWNSQLLAGFSTCGSGTCTNAQGRTTAQMQTQSTYVGFDFSTTWAINSTNNNQYPYLQNFAPRVISGTLPTTGGTINLYNNGSLVSSQVIGAGTGTFTFSTDFGTILDNDALLLYLSGYSIVNNLVALAPTSNGNLTGLNLTVANALTIGATNIANFSNSILGTAAGALSTTNLLYAVASNNLTLGNATNSTVNLTTTATSSYDANGTIAYIGGGSGSLTFNGPVTASSASITSPGNQTYNSTLSLGTNTALNGSTLILQDVQLGSNTLTLNTSSASSQVTGVISDTGGLTKAGSGIVTLLGTNTYTGATNINGGTLRLGAAGVLSDSTAVTLANTTGVTFDLNNFNETIASLAGAGTTGGTVTLGSGTLTTGDATNTTFAGVISGSGGLTKQGSGIFTLSGTNTYGGTTTINAGTLRLGAAGVLSDSTAVTLANVSGAVFDLNNFNETIASLAGGGTTGGNVTLGSGTLTTGDATNTSFGGVISGSGGLTKQGSGTFTLSNANTYDGATNINAGTISISNAAGLGSTVAGTTVVNGATLNLNNVAVGNEVLTLNGTGVGGNGALTGSGVSSLSGNITLNTDTTIGVTGTSLTLSGVIGGGASALTKVGSGTLILSGANTYSGATNINAGTLQLGSAGVLSDSTAVVLANTAGAILDLNNFNETIASLAGGGTTGGNVTLGSGTLTTGNATNTTFAGVISGTGGLTKQGSGIFTLSSANTYDGATNINAGTLRLGAAGVLADATAVTLANVSGAAFDLNNFNETIASLAGGGATGGNVTLGSGTLTTGDATNTSFGGVISGSGGLTKQGAGTFTLSNANTYDGATNINAGTISISNAAGLGSTVAGTTVSNGATLNLNNVAVGNEVLTLNGTGVGGNGALTGSGVSSLSGNITLNTDTTIGVPGTSLTLSGVIGGGSSALTKVGSGTLILSGANTYSGATNINAGTLRLGAAGVLSDSTAVTLANVSGAILDLNNFNETIGSLAGGGTTGGNVTLGNATLTTGDASSTSFGGVISGSGGLTKQGSGTFTLSNANTYDGATNINAGTISISNAAGLGSTVAGTTVSNGATLNLNNVAVGNEVLTLNGTGVGGNGALTGSGTSSLSGNITLNTDSTIGVPGTSLTLSGVIGGGSSALTKVGSGTLILSGANTYTGATNINAGTLRLGAAGVLSDSTAVTLANVSGAILDLNNFNETIGSLAGGGTTGGNVTLGNATLTTGDASSTSFGGVISGSGGLTKQGAGTFTLSNANTYDGATNINAGTISINNAAGLGSTLAGTTVAAGATLNLNNVAVGNEALTLNGTGVGGNGALTGSGVSSLNGNITLNTDTTIGVPGTSLTLSGVIGGGASALTKVGSGTLILSGANTYTGATNINAGTLRLGAAGVLSDSTAVVLANTAGAILDLNNFNETIASLSGGGTTGGNVTLGSGTLTTGDATNTTFAGVISGSGGLIKQGAGTFTLSNANTYDGATNINAGTISISNAAGLGSTLAGTTVANGATLNLNNVAVGNESLTLNGTGVGGNGALTGSGVSSLSGNITLNTDTTIGVPGTSLTLSGVIGGGASALTKVGSGTLILSGANTYTGATNINAGTLQLGAAGVLSDSTAVVLANTAGAILDLNNFNETIASLSGGGTTGGNVTLGSGTLTTGDATNTTFSGVISGNGGLTKQGAGIFTLSGTNTYNGATNINAGTLQLGAAGVLSDSTAVVLTNTAGAILDLNNFNETIASLSGGGTTGGNVTLGSGTLTTGDATNTTFAGVISGSGGLTKQGAGTFTLSNANTYDGATNINAGTISISNAAGLGSTLAGTTVANGATLNLNNVAVGNEALTLNGTGVGGNGALTGSGVSSLSGNITLNTDTTIGVPGTSLTLSGVIGGGASALTKVGSGTLILSGANTYTGATNINAGTLRLGAAGVLSDSTAVVLANTAGAILDLNNFNETIASLSGGGTTGGNVTLGSGTLTTGDATNTTFAGVISGSGGLTKQGAGTFTLSNANTYDGATNINAGTISINNAAGLGSTLAGTTVAAGATLNLNNVAVGNEALTLNGTGVGGNGALTGSGVSSLSGNITLNTDTTIGVPGTSLTLSGVIGGGASALTKVGSGTLILSGANTYTGATNINGGTLRLGAAGVLSDSTAVVLANTAGAILDLNNFNETIASLSGGGTTGGNVTLGSGTLTTGDASNTTFEGVISGNGGITKQGTGIFTLAGSNTYSGETNINAGTLNLNHTNALGNSSEININSGANLNLSFNNATLTNANDININGTGPSNIGALTATGSNIQLNNDIILGSDSLITSAGNFQLNGLISGAHNLTLDINGNIVLPTIQLTNNSHVSVTANGSVTQQGGGISSDSLDVTANTGITLTGSNTVNQFTATNNVSGNINFHNTASTLDLGLITQLGNGNVSVTNTGNLTVNGNIQTSGGDVNLTTLTTTNSQQPIIINGDISTQGGSITAYATNPNHAASAIIVNGLLSTLGGAGQGVLTIDSSVDLNTQPVIGGGNITLQSGAPPVPPTPNNNNVNPTDIITNPIVRDTITDVTAQNTLLTNNASSYSPFTNTGLDFELNTIKDNNSQFLKSLMNSTAETVNNIMHGIGNFTPIYNPLGLLTSGILNNKIYDSAIKGYKEFGAIQNTYPFELLIMLLALLLLRNNRQTKPALGTVSEPVRELNFKLKIRSARENSLWGAFNIDLNNMLKTNDNESKIGANPTNAKLNSKTLTDLKTTHQDNLDVSYIPITSGYNALPYEYSYLMIIKVPTHFTVQPKSFWEQDVPIEEETKSTE